MLKFFKAAQQDETNIVFLDIDGVLLYGGDGSDNILAFNERLEYVKDKLGSLMNDLSKYDIGATLRFNEESVQYLKALCENNSAKIVVSSNWRISGDEKRSMHKLTSLFKLWDLDHLIIDVTPSTYESRGNEIQQWLNNTNINVGSFVVIDDQDSGLTKNFGEKFISTRDTMLFTQKHYEQATDILKQKCENNLEM